MIVYDELLEAVDVMLARHVDPEAGVTERWKSMERVRAIRADMLAECAAEWDRWQIDRIHLFHGHREEAERADADLPANLRAQLEARGLPADEGVLARWIREETGNLVTWGQYPNAGGYAYVGVHVGDHWIQQGYLGKAGALCALARLALVVAERLDGGEERKNV